jgi:hypothetical protein
MKPPGVDSIRPAYHLSWILQEFAAGEPEGLRFAPWMKKSGAGPV